MIFINPCESVSSSWLMILSIHEGSPDPSGLMVGKALMSWFPSSPGWSDGAICSISTWWDVQRKMGLWLKWLYMMVTYYGCVLWLYMMVIYLVTYYGYTWWFSLVLENLKTERRRINTVCLSMGFDMNSEPRISYNGFQEIDYQQGETHINGMLFHASLDTVWYSETAMISGTVPSKPLKTSCSSYIGNSKNQEFSCQLLVISSETWEIPSSTAQRRATRRSA